MTERKKRKAGTYGNLGDWFRHVIVSFLCPIQWCVAEDFPAYALAENNAERCFSEWKGGGSARSSRLFVYFKGPGLVSARILRICVDDELPPFSKHLWVFVIVLMQDDIFLSLLDQATFCKESPETKWVDYESRHPGGILIRWDCLLSILVYFYFVSPIIWIIIVRANCILLLFPSLAACRLQSGPHSMLELLHWRIQGEPEGRGSR